MALKTRRSTKRRLAPEVRRQALLDVAAGLVLDQGFLPLSVEAVAVGGGVSKTLVYAYFPTQHDLYNALAAQSLAELTAAGLEAALALDDLEAAVRAGGDIYFRHVAEHGPLLHIILRDRYMAGKVAPDVARARDRLIAPLVRRVRGRFALPPQESVAAVSMGLTLPEECGRLVRQGDLELDRGAELCGHLILGALEGLARSAGQLSVE
ncbi:MAG: hypothetical protein K0Q62_147 [Phenylobacterium sp.]|nr:hypothetical protein [Phenylobacterium sp.]HVK40951.1 TetR/AcrR family transcriptional regulator [Phenylobacterium sp.]